MSSGNRVLDFFADAVRQGAISHVDAAYADGFNTAANIGMDAVTEQIDLLVGKISSTGPLSDGEQVLLAGLMRLRTDLDTRLRNHPND